MEWASLGIFLSVVIVLVLAPGPDTAVVLKQAMVHGPRPGLWTVAGVSLANLTQGLVAAAGLGALIVTIDPLFWTIKYVGAAYLVVLGALSIRAAIRGRYAPLAATDPAAVVTGPADDVPSDPVGTTGGTVTDDRRTRRRLRAGGSRSSFLQGALSNLTNPKVLIFYLAILPQFLTPGQGVLALVFYATATTVLGTIYQALLVLGAHAARRFLTRRRVRRAFDAVTGSVLVAFGLAVALEH
ncbi:LysE family translocator [Naumannella halotolerans]|uniref:Threonine/homoserine/homoserine lactone efflux protein n=1 Tax=Naumannella halotolerans TaxID=993414 RepID=A0A4R7J9S3_9ACTN|nr:LysE family transporter [Naumannella halotolerans]TDT33656.1 threonine/homoserine/homoserine lactone efflux protein [Naumannella halotolerans]